ncbi:hypothetical protein C8J56DRAFT_570417 [Mycena floridula]|nr:hypothetical protein C8J56DRAFT_570417 [Mycena floridula]
MLNEVGLLSISFHAGSQFSPDKRRSAVLDWISALDFHSTQREIFAKRASGTGNWFIEHPQFLNWLSGNLKFLWCLGNPGVGKTSLSSLIVDHLHSMIIPDVAVVYIYCDYNRETEQTPTELLGSILKQLAETRETLSDDLLALHKTCESHKTRPTIPLLMAALQKEVQSYSRVYIVVDALDECSEAARSLFLSAEADDGLCSLSNTVRLLFTSRNILSIAQEFKGKTRLDISAHEEDLQTYIKGRILRDKRLNRLVNGDSVLETEIIDQVIMKAAGKFLQAQLHLDSLSSQLNRKALRAALSTLPEAIMSSYDSAMLRIDAQGKAERELAYQVFYWLTYAKRPLKVEELQHALAVTSDPDMTTMDTDAIVDAELLASVCAGLVVISGSKQNMQLVHYTTQEYFKVKQTSLFPGIHSSMAITCITYLSLDVFGDPIGIPDQHPFYEYAALYWVEHARDDEKTVVEAVLSFVEKDGHFVNAASLFDRWHHHHLRAQSQPYHFLAQHGLHQTFGFLNIHALFSHCLDENGWTLLHSASWWGQVEVVKVLLDQAVDPNSTSSCDGRTALSYATERRHQEVIQLLLQLKNIQSNLADHKGHTPFMHACRKGYINIVKIFLEREDIDHNCQDHFSRTALTYALEHSHLEVAQLLLQHEFSLTQKLPFNYAAGRSAPGVISLQRSTVLTVQWPFNFYCNIAEPSPQ